MTYKIYVDGGYYKIEASTIKLEDGFVILYDEYGYILGIFYHPLAILLDDKVK